MKEQLIEFETAKLAKEKGFNSTTEQYYDRRDYNKSWNTVEIFNKRNIGKKAIPAPTQSLLQKWLREEYHCVVTPIIIGGLTPKTSWYDYDIYHSSFTEDEAEDLEMRYKTYEQALEAGLIEALKLI